MAHIVGLAVMLCGQGDERVVGFVYVVLVLCLGIKQGLEGTVLFLLHVLYVQGLQQGKGRVGMLVHQRLGTMEGFGYRLRVVAS